MATRKPKVTENESALIASVLLVALREVVKLEKYEGYPDANSQLHYAQNVARDAIAAAGQEP